MSKKLKGGEASSGPHSINRAHDTYTRQRKRQKAKENAGQFVTENYGNSLPRKQRRKIALNRARLNWKKERGF